MSLVAAYFSGIRGHLQGNLSSAQAKINTSVLEVWLIGSAVADTLIAGTMIYLVGDLCAFFLIDYLLMIIAISSS